MAGVTTTMERAGPSPVPGGSSQPLPASHSIGYLVAKRVMDVLLGGAMLIVAAPFMLILAALIKLTSRGPIIFKQPRAGLRGRPFVMYKFRTMYEGAEDDREYVSHLNENDGPIFKIGEDPRLTPIGRLLRRSSMDELPQLVNVLAGHMSLVGPRPLWLPEAKQVNGAGRLRTSVKPGLTGLWQISGRSELSFTQCVDLDLYYILHRGLLLDLLILIQTIPAVISGYGAY